MPPKKKGVARGAGVDMELVERFKTLHALGRTNTQIAKEHGVSVDTVRRYIRREDADPAWEEARTNNIERFVDKAWKTVHLLGDIVEKAAVEGDFKPKDAAITQAVLFDKIEMAQHSRATVDTENVKTVTFEFYTEENELQNTPIADPDEVPCITGEVQGDDLRGGGGQDLLRLPGGCEDGSGAEVLGGDSGLDVQES